MHIRRMIYACLLAIAVVTLWSTHANAAARGLIIEEDGNEIVWVWDGVATGEVELLEGGTSGTLEIFWLANDSSRFQPSGVGDSVKIEVSDSSLVAITKLTTWTFTLSSIDEHGHVDMILTQYLAGSDDYTSPDIEVHIEHDHAEAEGLRLVQNGDTIVYVDGATVTGEVEAHHEETTDPIEVWFVSAEAELFQPDTADGFALVDSLTDTTLATIQQTGEWEFTITGVEEGMTSLFIGIFHEDHIDYLSPEIEVHVEEEHAEAEGLRLVRNGDTVVVVDGSTVTGEIEVFHQQTSSPITVWFVSAESELFQPDTVDGFSLEHTLSDTTLASFQQTGEWEFTVTGIATGTTSLTIGIHHEEHTDYTSPDIDLSVTSCCINRRGNVNNSAGDGVTVADLVFLVQFLFNNGSAPVCNLEANVNGTGNITVADLTYLVQFLFNSGPQPPLCP